MLYTVACQAPLSMEFSTKEYWSGLPCPPPRSLPNSEMQPMSLMSPALAGRFFTLVPPGKPKKKKKKKKKKYKAYYILHCACYFTGDFPGGSDGKE